MGKLHHEKRPFYLRCHRQWRQLYGNNDNVHGGDGFPGVESRAAVAVEFE